MQECVKRLYGRCFFCGDDRYETLECHRVVPGAVGGKYHHDNAIPACGSCHNLITAGKVVTHGIHRCTFARFVVHWTDEHGVEHWDGYPRRQCLL